MGKVDWETRVLASDPRLAVTLDSSERPSTIDIRAILGVLRRQATLIGATFFIICAVATLILLQLTPIYSATALIIVDPRQQNILDPGGQMTLAPGDLGRVESEVEILRSPAVFLKVIDDLDLAKDSALTTQRSWREWLEAILGFETEPVSAEDQLKVVLDALRKSVSISRVGVTYLIEVTARSADPARAAQIANAMADAYVDEQVGAKVEMIVGIQRALMSRLDEASAARRRADIAMDDFIAKNIDSIADDVSRRDLADIRNRIATRSAEVERLSRVLAEARSDLPNSQWDELVNRLDSEALRVLNERRVSAERALQEVGADTNRGFDIRADLAKIDEQMTEEAGVAIERVQESLSASEKAEQDLRGELRERVIRSDLPKELLTALYEAQQEANVTRSVYQDLLNRVKAIEAQKNVQVPDSRIVSRAIPPSKPTFPRKRLILGVTGLLALMLGVGLAFLREHYIGGFVSEAQAEQVLRIPVVSSLPRLSGGGSRSGDSPDADETVIRPLSAYSEAVRRARLALELTLQRTGEDARCRVIVVTSAMPGEGKTQTAISLARSLAIAGRKTLLIDCDLRRPSLHKSLGVQAQKGIAEYLAADQTDASFSSFLIADPHTSLSLMLGQLGSRAQTDILFETPRFAALMDHARASFDYVVLDTSPVLPVVDPRLLLRYANAVLFVVRWAATSQREAGAALADIERSNTRAVPIVGVLNRASLRAGGYGSAYGSYYGIRDS